MTERHRIVCQERLLAIPADEVDQELNVQVGTIFLLGIIAQFTILIDHRIVITWSLVPAKQAPTIEAHPAWLIKIVFHQRELPFSGNDGPVAGGL